MDIRVNPDPVNITDRNARPSFADELAQKCVVDTVALKYSPIYLRFYHYDRTTARRKLLWHDGELQSNVRNDGKSIL